MQQRWHLLYSKLIFRKLHYEKSDAQLTSLEAFVKVSARDYVQSVVGKKYKINATKILRRRSLRDASDNIKESKSYFCSELVASAYKRLGLLPEEKSASQYWPGTGGTWTV